MPSLLWPLENRDKILSKALDRFSPPVLVLSAFALGCGATASSALIYRRFFRRIPNGDWITPDIFAKKRWVKGRVTSVGDSDNFRFYHTPGFGWHWPLKFRRIPLTTKGLKDRTMHIRIAGVDAPEAAHFGRPGQPYAEEALAWLKQQVLGKTVYCQLLRRDQYSRIVAVVNLPPRLLPGSLFYGKWLSLEMLKAGWVTTYEQAGAEYGKWSKEEFNRVENEAKAKRVGMWAKGTNVESPSEFKRRHAQGVASETKVAPNNPPQTTTKGWLRRLFS
ncbi:hypothetical protein C8F01DRAFT_1154070 [Mycena amicta]|nr:hypothetical protein C8F01DRAFT_1154070 [Mycena amicta]